MRVRRLLLAVLALLVPPLVGAAGCTTFGTDEAPSGNVDAASDAPATPLDGSVVDAPDAAPAPPFCPRDASFCDDFTATNVSLGWEVTEHPELGMLQWSKEGATTTGSLQVTVPRFAGTGNRESIYLRRGIGNLSGKHAHLEASLRFEVVPDQGDTAPLRLIIGNALLYLYFTQAGWRVDDGYYGLACGAGPCGGGPHRGTKLPVPLHTWDHVSLDIALAGAGRYVATFDAASGEHFAFTLDPGYVPDPRFDSHLGVGVTAASPATVDRDLLIDDVALTISP